MPNLQVSPPLKRRRTASPPACKFREASLNDYQGVTDLQAKYGLGTRSYEDWAHLWTHNPAYAEVKQSWPMGWVLENAAGQVVGYLGNIPVFCEYRSQRLIVSTSYAWVVDREYRGYSMWFLDTYFGQKVDLFLNTTVGEQAVSAIKSCGLLPVPVGVWDSCAFRITNYRGFAESALRQRKVAAARLLSFAAAPVLYCADKLKRIARPRPQKFELLDGFDPRFDLFWNERKASSPDTLLAERSANVLQWHFGPAMARGQVWIVAHAPLGTLKAYAIFVRLDKPEIGLTRYRMADFQSLDGSDALRIPMMEWAAARCRREGIQMLEVLGFEAEDKQLAALLPRRRTLTSWQYYYLTRDQKLALELQDSQAWRPSPYDGDGSL